jgi:adenylate cyclase
VAMAETRRLAAIMFTDIVDFSRQMGMDEARMLRLLDVHNRIIQQAVAAHHGQVIKTIGDAFLVDFPSVVQAVRCAQQIQAQFRTHNVEKAKVEQIHVRIGIHLGDIIQRDGDVFGDGVNIASRLQTLAEADTICLSHKVYEEVAKKLDLGAVISLGRPKLKNIAERFYIYALLPQAPKGFWQTLQVQRLKLSRRVGTAHRVAAMVVLIAGTIVAARYLSLPIPSTQPLAPSTQTQPALPLPDKPSIVVLPFANMSGDPGQEYFSDGITEVLTSDLSKISSLFVIARNTAFTYKGKPVNVQAVGRELGVRYVLEGSLQKTSAQVRITTQLIDTTSGGHLWVERYDRPLQDIFALQDEIVQKIVTTLKLQLTLREQGILVRKTTDNLEAYDYWLRGMESWLRAFYERKKEANEQARQLFEKAIELDPQYAQAHTQLGVTYFLDRWYGWNRDPKAWERATELAQQAIALDGSLSQPHVLLGSIYQWQKQYEQAVAEAEQAVALDPNEAEGHMLLAATLVFAGRPDEAIGLMEKAMRLHPQYPITYLHNLGWAYRVAGRYAEAIAPLKRVVTLNPNFFPSHFNLAICYAELGREDEARTEVKEMLRITPNFSLELARQTLPFKDPAALERTLAGLRKAGLK